MARADGKDRAKIAAVPLPPAPGNSSTVGGALLATDDVDLQRIEEAIADCTEAIRVAPDKSRLYLERAAARPTLDPYEEAVAEYDRAIQFDLDNAAADLGRYRAKSEFGSHDEAISDYDQAVRRDPEAASASGDR